MLTRALIQDHLNQLTKPPGSLGKLEEVAIQLCLIQQTLQPQTSPRRLVLFAADHGVVDEGVTAWPSAVTQQMVQNIISGGAASSVLARTSGTDLRLVDVGTLGPDLGFMPGYLSRKVRAGSRNLAREPALTLEEFQQSLQIGREQAYLASRDGCRLVATGEMGIGNTTSASCLTALLTGVSPDQLVGRGAGADALTLERKRAVVHAVLDKYSGLSTASAMAALCGYEIVAMAGFFLGAKENELVVVLDGFIATAAALIAHHLQPNVTSNLISAHRSAEPGHTAALEQLGLVPFLDQWNLRLGEGTGALLFLPLLDAAASIVKNMATFASAGVGQS